MRKMQAKFRGRCKGCGEVIAVGSDILWSKQTGAFHDNERCHTGTHQTRVGNDGGSIADYEVDVDAQLARRDEAEYQQGYHDVAAIHAISEAGSDFREQLYRELEERDYNLYG
jgi:hypothetical protein